MIQIKDSIKYHHGQKTKKIVGKLLIDLVIAFAPLVIQKNTKMIKKLRNFWIKNGQIILLLKKLKKMIKRKVSKLGKN